MSYFYGNPNFSANPLLKGPEFALAGTTDYTKFLKGNPMFDSAFQVESGNNTGVPPEVEPTVAKTNDPGGVTKSELQSIFGDVMDYQREQAALEPQRRKERYADYLEFDKQRLAQGKPYALMEKIPDVISKGFDRQARQMALQGALIGASSNDLANIVGGTRIPNVNIPGGSAIGQQQYF